MSLPTERTEHHFVLKDDGKIYWIEKMPDKNRESIGNLRVTALRVYEQVLQSAISKAVEVSNQEEVMKKIYGQDGLVDGLPENFYAWKERSIGKIFPLKSAIKKRRVDIPCQDEIVSGMEALLKKTVAFVTFSQPEREETQEEREALNDKLWYEFLYDIGSRMHYLKGETCPDEPEKMRQFLESKYTITITRKTP